MTTFWLAVVIIIGIWAGITIAMIPVQLRYLEAIEEERKKKKQSQNDYYDEKPADEQLLNEHAQGNILLLPANLIAHAQLKRKQKKTANNSLSFIYLF